MKPKYLLLIFFGFSMFHLSSAQNSLTSAYPISLSDMEELIKIISSQQATTGSEQIESSYPGVYLQQIGDRNSASVDISSKQIDLQLVQNGNDNFLGIWATARTVEGNVIQNGNNNFAFDFADDPDLELPLNLSQTGDGHHFESHGINSIGNKLKFNMTGDSRMIIVRNFK